jgi:hydroxypyruvate reductase/glycerate 2-kinase
MSSSLRTHARAIWDAAVDAVRPEPLVREELGKLTKVLDSAPRILVVGAGKAGAAMAEAVELVLADRLDRIEGIVNVPADAVRPLKKIRLHAARPAATNFPTAEAVQGGEEMLRLARSAGPEDIALCLLSGGGSALLPAPAEGVKLEDKLAVTRLLHSCGATINEMNAVRKHLSAIKGGRLAQAFTGKAMHSLIISDVIGDPLDVIASGPTAPDSSTFADALSVLDRFQLRARVPAAVLAHLDKGAAGKIPETPKALPGNVCNRVIGNNALALTAAQQSAEKLGYRVVNLGSFIEGETRHVATMHADIARGVLLGEPGARAPVCILSGGETTVTLGPNPGKGGRNQEFVLAALLKLGAVANVVPLSGGTDGEDGPTDAAGALADAETLRKAATLGLNAADFLARHDAYHYFQATGDLLVTGLTQTNVMDVRVILIG